MNIPDELMVDLNGRLYCKSGGSVKKRLREWMKAIKATGPAPVNVIHQDGLKQLSEEAEMARGWGA